MRKQLLLELLTYMPFGGALYYLDSKASKGSETFSKLYKENPGTIHPEVKKAIKSHNIKVLKTPKQVEDWLYNNVAENNEENSVELDEWYDELVIILESENAASVLPKIPGGQAAIVISPDIYNTAVMGHEVGHILDYHSRGIKTNEEVWDKDSPGFLETTKQLIPGMSIKSHPTMKVETSAWDHAKVPEDDELRSAALQTYEDTLKAPQYATGGLAAGFLSRPLIKKLLKMKK